MQENDPLSGSFVLAVLWNLAELAKNPQKIVSEMPKFPSMRFSRVSPILSESG